MLTLTVSGFSDRSQHERAAPIMKNIPMPQFSPRAPQRSDAAVCTIGRRRYHADDRRPARLSLPGYFSKMRMRFLEASRTVRCFVAAWYGPCLNAPDANQNDERAWSPHSSREATDLGTPSLNVL